MNTNATKHTPGPWKAVKCGVYQNSQERIDVPVHVASTGDDEYKGIGCEAQLANARLIAAAPDLLAACEMALGEFHAQAQQPDAIRLITATDALCAALAKAKG